MIDFSKLCERPESPNKNAQSCPCAVKLGYNLSWAYQSMPGSQEARFMAQAKDLDNATAREFRYSKAWTPLWYHSHDAAVISSVASNKGMILRKRQL